jgi:flagellar basal body-associated protein FliL
MAKSTKRKKKAAPSGPPLSVRLKEGLRKAAAELAVVLRGFKSPDPGTRRMTAVFYLSILGFALSAGFGLHLWKTARQAGKLAQPDPVRQQLGKFLEQQGAEDGPKRSTANLGIFTVEVKKAEGDVSARQAELEIVAECSSKKACDAVEGNLIRVRDEVSSVLVGWTRDEYLSLEGKRKIRVAIIERLNKWLVGGKVVNLYFSRFILT